MMRLAILTAASIAVAMAFFASASVFADHSWGNYHWPSGNRTLEVDNQADLEYEVGESIQDWNGLNTPIQMSIGGGSDVVVRSKNMNAWYLGLAEIRVDTATGHILEGRVTLNDRYLKEGNFYGYDSADRLAVLCQELGHVLGLDHTHDYDDTCMNDRLVLTGDGEQVSPSQLAGTTPNSHDGAQLELIYGHSDDGGEPGGGGGGNGGPPCDKKPDHPKCQGGGVWITIDVVPASQP